MTLRLEGHWNGWICCHSIWSEHEKREGKGRIFYGQDGFGFLTTAQLTLSEMDSDMTLGMDSCVLFRYPRMGDLHAKSPFWLAEYAYCIWDNSFTLHPQGMVWMRLRVRIIGELKIVLHQIPIIKFNININGDIVFHVCWYQSGICLTGLKRGSRLVNEVNGVHVGLTLILSQPWPIPNPDILCKENIKQKVNEECRVK